MGDGHLGKCKECSKKDITENRNKKIDYYREFDRMRADIPKRVAARREYAEKIKTDDAMKIKKAIAISKHRNKFPEKYKSHSKVEYNIKNKKIEKPESCSICGNKTNLDGHHPDYSKPLEVIWVCRSCHAKVHKELRALERASNN